MVKEFDQNIRTRDAINILIDLLRQDAYKSRSQVVYSNHEGTTPANYSGVTFEKGKVFARQGIGIIRRVEAWIKNVSASAQNLEFWITYAVGGPRIIQGTVSVPAGYDGWIDLIETSNTTVRSKWWTYDKIVVTLYSTSLDLSLAYTPLQGDDFVLYKQAYFSDDRRHWIRVTLDCIGIGDLPISGTVNNIQIPNTASSSASAAVNLPSGTETVLATIYGAGKHLRTIFRAGHVDTEIRIFIDGVRVKLLPSTDTFGQFNLFSYLADVGYGSINILLYQAGAAYNIIEILTPFDFQRSFELRAYQASGSPVSCDFVVQTNVLK